MQYNSFNCEPKISVNLNNSTKPFKLLNNIMYIYQDSKTGDVVRVDINKGFNWNGADIPTLFWSIIGYSKSSPEVLPASLIHDWLCNNKGFLIQDGVRISSDIFKNILLLYKVPKYKAELMAVCIRIWQTIVGGWN